MAKTGVQYADDVRELRAQGIEFASASRGYLLADAANWSSGQKAAVTRAINQFDFTEFDAQEAAREEVVEPEQGLADEEIEVFFDDAAGDAEEDYDDIPFFDFDEAEDLSDEENDAYDETPS